MTILEDYAKGMLGIGVGLVVLYELERAMIDADIEDFMKHYLTDQSKGIHF